MAIAEGTRFDRYEILALLGSGGMGEVYLARDSRLERRIALKLLPQEFTRDSRRLRRFEQEAKAASALNHPNIITIHEIGMSREIHFISTEFIDGNTLRQLISGGRMSLTALLEISIQVGNALSAAHEAGIIHRDIKPENVMIRPDGIVKVLDFGLAKLTERHSQSSDPDAQTMAELETDPGTVMGTATYMSPEQTRGLRVDSRTDIYSLGVVLYEMIAGRAPFTGRTPADIMSEVLNRDPAQLSSIVPNLPTEMNRIVSKAMRKDRDERYQTIRDLLVDLKDLKRDLETFEAESLPQTLPIKTSPPRNGLETVVMTSAEPEKAVSTQPVIIRTTSSAEYLVTQIKQNKGRVLLALLALAAMVFLSLAWFKRDHTIDSIAVMPFVNLNTDQNAQQLSDSITDSIINNLSQLSNLDVKPRGAVLRYKGREVDSVEVARDLDVHAVLTGRVVQNGSDISVTVALVDARENRHLWGEQYTRKIADLLLIQQEISREVSDKLKLKLSGDEKLRQDAYQAYLKGRNAWSKRTSQGIREGLKYFQEATRIDPTFAPAYAGLADCYSMSVIYSILPAREAFPKAREAARRALDLDQGLAEAHTAMAFINFEYDWKWLEAEEGFKRAIDLKPGYAPAHQWYSSLLIATGRTSEAVAEAMRAQELEPFSLIGSSHLAWINFLSRRYENAMEQSRLRLRLDPNFFPAHRYLALAYQGQGKYQDAIDEFRKALALSPKSIVVKAELAHVCAIAGKRDEARQMLAELEERLEENPAISFHLALVHAGLNDRDRVMDLLNKSFDERSERLVWLKVDPRFDNMRTDPRFIDLLRRLNLTI